MAFRFRLLFISFRFPIQVQLVHYLDPARVDALVRRNRAIACNTRRVYAGTLERLNEWLRSQGRGLDDLALASYIEFLQASGLAPETAAMAVTAVRFYCKATGQPTPDGPLTHAALKELKREPANRGRGQAQPLLADDAAAILAMTARSSENGNGGGKTVALALRRSLVDAALVAIMFLGALRRSEAATLTWGDIQEAADGRGIVIHVRRSKTNPHGVDPDVRYITGEFADAVRRLQRETGGEQHPERLVFGGLTEASLSRRLNQAAAEAGISKRITAHSGRVGLAVELTLRGASTHDIMLAGHWKSPIMVARYSAAARAENGAVARFMGPDFLAGDTPGEDVALTG